SAWPAHGGGVAGGPRHYRQPRNRPTGAQVRPAVCQPDPSPPSRVGEKWHLGEVVLKIAGVKHWLWRAVDQTGIGHCQLKRPRYARCVGGTAARVEELLCSPAVLPAQAERGRKKAPGFVKLTMPRRPLVGLDGSRQAQGSTA